MHEIPIYVDSCSDVYRPLAEVLIGSGVRISEALALRTGDLELDDSGGVIVVYRSRKKANIGSTKSDRFRAVEIGPRTSSVLRTQIAQRPEFATSLADDTLVFVMPVRGPKRSQGRWESAGVGDAMDRTTVSRDWHKQALRDAALRDMPLHALRHTAAASWLAAGNSLMYVQRQLGHAASAPPSATTATWSATCSPLARSPPRKRSPGPPERRQSSDCCPRIGTTDARASGGACDGATKRPWGATRRSSFRSFSTRPTRSTMRTIRACKRKSLRDPRACGRQGPRRVR